MDLQLHMICLVQRRRVVLIERVTGTLIYYIYLYRVYATIDMLRL